MRQLFLKFVLAFGLFLTVSWILPKEDWGFFAHRRINRLAVFTLPPEMMVFYKKHIEFITDHAVDPDMRRYATKHEAVRHYIDIDHWGTYPFKEVPRYWTDALLRYAEAYIVNEYGDTIQVIGPQSAPLFMDTNTDDQSLSLGQDDTDRFRAYRGYFKRHILPQYYEDEWIADCDSLAQILDSELDCTSAFMVDRFSEYGILPYHLVKMQRNLTRAFKEKNVKRILRLSSEFGHYIGDAHVPLHTTVNYNGQLTNQVGIHAFWESRIPELFADKEFDFFVGKAEYFDDASEHYWDMVLKSHSYVDSVLLIESDLRRSFPEDEQFCYDQRLERTVLTQCRAFARAYHERMDGMVEDRMRASVLAIGSAWYTAWVDAGQPDLEFLNKDDATREALAREAEELKSTYRSGEAKGRAHGQ